MDLLKSLVVSNVRFKLVSYHTIFNCDSKSAQNFPVKRTETAPIPALFYSFLSYRRS